MVNKQRSLDKMKAKSTLLIAFSLIMCGGCETVSSTSKFYRPLTTIVYPPKPKEQKIPILGALPKEKHEVIGQFSFSAGYGYDYMIKAIEYNARQAGADAAVMVDSSSASQQFTYTVPGYTTTQPVTTYSSGSAYGTANYYGSGGYSGYGTSSVYGSGTSTTYVPVHTPGYTGVGTSTRHSIAALMIIFK
jgi:hypothetical protein